MTSAKHYIRVAYVTTHHMIHTLVLHSSSDRVHYLSLERTLRALIRCRAHEIVADDRSRIAYRGGFVCIYLSPTHARFLPSSLSFSLRIRVRRALLSAELISISGADNRPRESAHKVGIPTYLPTPSRHGKRRGGWFLPPPGWVLRVERGINM